MHGIVVEKTDAPTTVTAQSYAVDSVIERGRAETPRLLKDVTGRWNEAASRSLPAGSYIVPAGQHFGLAAFYLLEPESEDGLMKWSFLDGVVAPRSEFPIWRIVKPTTVRSRVVR